MVLTAAATSWVYWIFWSFTWIFYKIGSAVFKVATWKAASLLHEFKVQKNWKMSILR